MRSTNAIGAVVSVVAGLHALLGCAQASDTPPKLATMLREASAVVICNVVVTNGTVRQIVADTLLIRPGIDLPYATGDEIIELRSERLPNRSYGDQDILFLRGNPARPKEWITVHHRKVAIADGPIYYNMTLDEVKAVISADNPTAPSAVRTPAEPGR